MNDLWLQASVERVKMSRRLAEEAMNYFEECVSISTFDSSDLSSLEDPQPCSVDGIQPMGNSRFFHSEGSTISASHFPGNQPNPHEVIVFTMCSYSELSKIYVHFRTYFLLLGSNDSVSKVTSPEFKMYEE